MGEYAVPLLIAAVAITLTYVCCLRPMRRHADGAASACCAPSCPEDATANEVAALSREIELLRRSMADPADARLSHGIGQADIPN